jgi:hypothetical protein
MVSRIVSNTSKGSDWKEMPDFMGYGIVWGDERDCAMIARVPTSYVA